MKLSLAPAHCARAASILCLVWLAACKSAAQSDGTPVTDIAANPDSINAVPDAPGDPYSMEIGNVVYFETDSSSLGEDAQGILQRQAQWLKSYPATTFTIEGHADERGTREYNLGLGERRANAVASYLVALGIDGSRVSVISYGKERPLCAEATAICWGQNRRGVTTLNAD